MAHEPTRTEPSRLRVEQAAVAAFAEKGFYGTTTRDIAAAAGMSPAGLYVHHRSKEDLLYEISREGHLETLRLVRAAASTDGSAVRGLEQLMYRFARHHAEWHTQARVVNYELAALSPAHLTEILDIRREIDAEMRRVVVSGVDSGEFNVPDIGIAVAILLSLGIDLARWYREGRRWTPHEIAASYAAMALRIVGAEPTG